MRSGEGVMRLDDRLVSQLFVRLQSLYGHLWSSRFASAQMLEAARAEWAISLAGRDAEVIHRAVEMCKRQYDRPPSLPEFLRLCRPVCDAHRVYRALPLPPADAVVARAGMAEVKRLLGR